MSETALSFGIKTTPANVSYTDILRVWLDADAIPEIEHAWLYDHLLPRVGAGSEPIYEAWTLLTALAAQTRRLRVGVLATNNRIRHPAVLAKIAANVDEISNGRLDFGIGVGGLPKSDPRFATMVAPEYEAFGIPVGGWGAAVAGLSEACTIIRRLWSGEEFDFAGEHYRLIGARCSPTPVQPRVPILIAGTGASTLRIVAEHADLWNAIGPPLNTAAKLADRRAVLDSYCTDIGRDPRTITRSVQLAISYDDPARTRDAVREMIEVGFTHVVLNLPSPYPSDVAHRVAADVIRPILEQYR
jgi:alkanesulfonate monooxygenase SsuD/methylene tetrahydromethanopterin reductase-like flavin-dependent oxidoreductase (luciferase family)